MESVNGTIQTVLLPVYSKKQDSVSSVAKMVSKTVRISSLLLFPMMVGLAAVAEPLVSLLLTDKWLECVPYLQIFAIGYLFQAIQLAIIQAIKAIGDSGTPLKLEIIKNVWKSFPDCYDSERRADFRVFLADLQCDFSSAEYVRGQKNSKLYG